MSNTPDLYRTLGSLESRVTKLEQDMTELKADVKTILATLSEVRGGWKFFLMFGGFCATIGALAGKFIPYLWSLR